jgi:hypothetical protein
MSGRNQPCGQHGLFRTRRAGEKEEAVKSLMVWRGECLGLHQGEAVLSNHTLGILGRDDNGNCTDDGMEAETEHEMSEDKISQTKQIVKYLSLHPLVQTRPGT